MRRLSLHRVMAEKEQIIKDTLSLTIASYLAYFVRFLRGFILRRLLGPNLFGLYSVLIIVENYGIHSHLGAMSGAEKDLPYLIGKKDLSKLENAKNTAFSFVGFAASILIFLVFISTFLFKFSELFKYGLRIICLAIFFRQIASVFIVVLRSYKEFVLIAKLTLVSSLVGLIATWCLTYFLSIKGSLISLSAGSISTIIFIFAKTHYRFKFSLNYREIRRLIKIGFPLLILGLMYLTITSIDRIMIYGFIGPTSVGYYSIAVMAFNFAFFLPTQVGIVMFPRFLQKYGETGNVKSLETYLSEPTQIMAYTMPIFIGSLFILAPGLIKLLLPAYVPGIKAMLLLLVGLFFHSLSRMSSHLLITLNKEKRIIIIQGLCIICSIIFDYSFIRAGFGIEGVALGTSLVYLIYNTVLIAYALSFFVQDFLGYLKFFAIIYSPTLYVLTILIAGRYFLKSLPMVTEMYNIIIKLLLFSLFSLPLIVLGYKKIKIPLLKVLLPKRHAKNNNIYV